MKYFYSIVLWFIPITICHTLHAQSEEKSPTKLLQIYEDNDLVNLIGQSTDNAYTNGTSVDFFYTKDKKATFFIDRLLPKAGQNSADIFSYGIMQIMFTPDNIATTDYQPDDYPYSGALFARHSLYSYNRYRKYDLHSEIVLGVSGPASLVAETQKLMHHLVQYQQPMGWDHQAANQLLLNFNFIAEKQIISINRVAEVIGGSGVFLGSMENAAVLYSEIRMGVMHSYFEGYLAQYSGSSNNKTHQQLQAYLFVKPQVSFFASNQLLQGTPKNINDITTNNSMPDKPDNKSYRGLKNLVYSINFGGVISFRRFAVSFSQNATSALLKNLYSHDYFNLSLFFAW